MNDSNSDLNIDSFLGHDPDSDTDPDLDLNPDIDVNPAVCPNPHLDSKPDLVYNLNFKPNFILIRILILILKLT